MFASGKVTQLLLRQFSGGILINFFPAYPIANSKENRSEQDLRSTEPNQAGR